MTTSRRSWCWQLGLVSSVTVGSTLIFVGNRTLAQITPDGTLGAESSRVTPHAEVKGQPADLIEGGAERGANLFHSFSEFNVGEFQRVYFANPAGIENILSRVTGTNPSNILGTLGVDGAANLFLLNPNGIMFGANAQLDIEGSFVASTANSLEFEDGSSFSAATPGNSSLLTVSVPLGLQYGANQVGKIDNAGNLEVGSGQTLSLSGDTVTSTGSLTAPGGRVEVLGNRVGLLENARIDVSSETGGGTVLIGGDFQGNGTVPNAVRTFVGSGVTINADALTNGDGGRVIVWADEATGFYGNISARGGSEGGNGGLVEVSGKLHLIFRGTVDTNAVNGLSGTLLLDPVNIIIANGTGDETGDGNDTFAGNNSGIEGSILSVPLSDIDDTAPTTIYESELEGLAGDTNVVLQATNDITVEDLADNELTFASGNGLIIWTADADGDGVGSVVMEDTEFDTLHTNGRDIVISGASLTLGNIDTSGYEPPDGEPEPPEGDAGQLLGTAQVLGTGSAVPLESISGNLFSSADVDLFQIYLAGERTFSATTVDGTDIDTQLFLFDSDGFGVYANDDQSGCDCFQSTLPAGDGLTPIAPGIYYLAVSSYDSDPSSVGGEIFPDDFESVVGATGDGGESPLGGWNDEGFGTGSYTINLTGAEATVSTFTEPVPEPISEPVPEPIPEPVPETVGSITLNATNGSISAGNLDASNDFGDGGNITIEARDNITAIDLDTTADIDSGDAARGGAIILEAGGNVETGSLDSGSWAENNASAGGAITLEAGGNIDVGSGVIAGNEGAGGAISFNAGGNINIEFVVASSADHGGAITLQAGGDITTGSSPGSLSFIFTNSSEKGGAIALEAGGDIIAWGIDAGSFSNGDGGTITLEAGGNIDAGGSISSVASGNGGTITLEAGGNIDAGGGISSVASGNGGTITLEAGGNITTSDIDSFSSLVSGDTGRGGDIVLFSQSGDITINNLNSFSFSELGNAGSGGAISLVARAGSIKGDNTQLLTLSVAQREGKSAGTGGTVTLEARDTISGLEVLTLSSAGQSGLVQIQGFGDLLIQDTSLITSAQVEIQSPDPSGFDETETIILDINGFGQSGDAFITSTGNLTFDNVQVLSDANGANPAGNVNISSPGWITFNDSIINSNTQSTGKAGSIDVIAGQGLRLTGATSQLLAQTSDEGKAGSISVNAPQVIVENEAQISTSTTDQGFAGDIDIFTETLTMRNGGEILAFTSGAGDSGTINITATNAVLLGEGVQDSSPIISVETSDAGRPGNIIINTPNFVLSETARITATARENATNLEGGGSITISANHMNLAGVVGIFAETQSQSPGGVLTLQPYQSNPSLDVTFAPGAIISASTSSSGNGGDLQVSARESITMRGQGRLAVETSGTGRAGTITFRTNNLVLEDGLTVSAASSGGLGGSITIKDANTVRIDNSIITSELLEGTDAAITGGDIRISATDVQIVNGSELRASTSAAGNAGNVIIENADNVLFDNSIATSEALSNATGNGQNISLQTQNLQLNNGSELRAISTGQGDAGNVILNVSERFEAMDGSVLTNSENTSGGSVDIAAGEIRLFGDSDITTFVNDGADNGGNITITTDSLIAFADSDILAFARDGRGGDITFETPIFFGFAYRPAPKGTDPATLDDNNRVDINASGAVDGVITLPNLDFIQNSLTELPENLIDTDNLLANSCIVRTSEQEGKFLITGAGNLPNRPGDASASPYPTGEVRTVPSENTSRPWQKGDPIVEPTGVYQLPNGRLVMARECS
jgi:filamentous hemagglutinin family protein